MQVLGFLFGTVISPSCNM